MRLNIQEGPIVVAGFCKSGTTVISKSLAYCLDVEWQNEIRELWHIDQYAVEEVPRKEIHDRLRKTGEDAIIKAQIYGEGVIKFPQAVYIPDWIAQNADLIVVVREPADTICAYLERLHRFISLQFSWDEVAAVSKQWNYAYRSLQFIDPSVCCVVRYEDFVSNPGETMDYMFSNLNKQRKKPVPGWIRSQVLPYYNFDQKGRPIRGVGRSQLSLSREQIRCVNNICKPALELLMPFNPKVKEYLQK